MAGINGEAAQLPKKDRLRSVGNLGSRLRDSWIGSNWHTLLVVLTIVFIAFFIRTYFAYSLSVDNGFLVSGGSDSYYHMRVIDHVTDTGHHLYADPLLNYPGGMRNARPPLYDWSVAVFGMFMSSLTGMATSTAVGYSLVFSTAVWGALTVIPVYLITRAAFGNKAGIVASLLFAIMAGNISRSVFSDADHDAMVLFFAVWAFYFMLMALMSVKGDKWVSAWNGRKDISSGVVSYFKANRKSLIYAALSGVSLSAVAMIWTGYTYLLIIVLAYFLVQILINRFRNSDSMGVVITVGVMLSVAFIIAAPVYYQMDYWYTWFDVPIYLFLAAMVVGLIFVVTRDYPWTIVMPSFTILAAVSLFVLSIFLPNIFEAIISGQGYLVKSKLYSTISEAQAPEFSTLALSFGVVTFWLSFVGVVWAAMRIPKNLSPYLIFVVVWTAVSMFMAVSAGRFMFNAAPAFAMTGGWIISIIIEKLRFNDISRTFAGVKGSPLTVLRRAIKLRHVFGAFFLIFLILLPNAWNAVDAAMPSEVKLDYDNQVFDIMKGIAKPAGYDEKNGTNWYFGAFSYSLPLPSSYWPAAWSWFRQQDDDINPVVSRPAFLSWWDYGFEAIQEGQHPTVADNFQNGYQFAGSVITCQSEQEAIALFVVRTLEDTGLANDSISRVLEDHGVDYSRLRDIMENPSRYASIVKNNPEVYGLYDSDLSAKNAQYAAARVELSKIGTDELVDLYHELREMTGIEIGYFAIDSRLFPFSATGGNIFYAPAKLSDRRINETSKDPIDFFVTKAIDSSYNEHDLNNVTPEMEIVSYSLSYKDMFYDSMLYRAFFGYGPNDIGYTSQGLPGISGSLSSLPSMQCWNMSHFRMVYRTAYYNPFPVDQISNHTDAWKAIGYDEALALQDQIDAGTATGAVDYSSYSLMRGVVFIQYYEGAIVEGTVTTESGQPYSDLWVTVLDEYGIPHETVKTDKDGKYSVIAPFGEVDIVYSYGNIDSRTKIGVEVARETLNITEEQSMRQKIDSDGNGKWDYYFDIDVVAQGTDISGKIYWDNDRSGTFSSADELIIGATAIFENESSGFHREKRSDSSGYSFVGLPAVEGMLYASYNGHLFGSIREKLAPMGNITVDIGIMPGTLNGTVLTDSEVGVADLELELTDMATGTINRTITNSSGGFKFDKLFPGNYSIEVLNSSLSVGTQLFSVAEGEQLEKQITVHSAFSLSGRVTLDALAVANATLILASDGNRVLTTTDERGRYAVILPEGDYTIYCLLVRDGREYVSVMRVAESSGARSMDLALQAGMIVSGTVVEDSDPVSNSTVVLKSRASGAVLDFVTNSTGGFRVVVPVGGYFIYVKGTSKAFWGDIQVSTSSDMSIVLSDSATLSGQVWFDSNFDGTRDEGEGVAQVSLKISDRDGREVTLVTDSEGEFSAVLPTGNSYSLNLAVDGYATRAYNYSNVMSSITEDIELVPLNRTTTGRVVLGTTYLEGMEITFEADGDGAMTASTYTDSSGSFSLSLRPGVYDIMIDQNVTAGDNSTRYQHSSSLVVAIGQDPPSLILPVTERVRVYGYVLPERGVGVTLTFAGPENRELSVSSYFELYLIAGDYSAYAVYDSRSLRYAFLGEVAVDVGVSPLNLTTVQAYSTYGTLEYNDQTFISVVPVTIALQTGGAVVVNTTAVGSFEALLPVGSYNVSVDYRTTARIDTEERYVRYTGNDTMTVPLTASNVVVLERNYDNSTVSGSIAGSDGTPVTAVFEFISDDGTSVNLTLVSGLGSYSASLAPGEYSLYIREIGGMSVYFDALEVKPYVDVVLNATLVPGIRLTGSTINGGAAGSASMEFSGKAQKTLVSDPDGSYEIVLPAGAYEIECSASGTENGISVEYKTTTVLTLVSDLSRTISLSKIEKHGVDLQWDSREKMTLLPGESATYNIRVVNNGNVPEIFELQGDTGTWPVAFSQDRIAVGFGAENSELVSVTLTAPSNAKVVHSGQKITVLSTIDSTVKDSVVIDAVILPVYSVELDFQTSADTDGTNYTHTMKLSNTGNVDDTYDITIANRDHLASLGWDAELGSGEDGYGGNLTLAVSSSGSEAFKLRLTPIRSNPEPGIQVSIIATSQNSSDTYSIFDLEPAMPEIGIPSDGVTATGQDVYVGPLQVPVGTIILAAMCVAASAVMILLSIQRGLLRRRKR